MSAIRASAPDLNRVRDDMKPRGIRPPAGFARVFPVAAWLFTCALPPASAHGATYVVDNGSADCSDAGPGTESQPYCTIGAAVAAHNGAGTTIEVKAGVYREQVTVPSSGTAGSPFVLEAQGQVVVEGADRYAAAGQWTAATGTEWVAAGVTWSPVQVVVDGVRLTASGSGPGTLAVNTFR